MADHFQPAETDTWLNRVIDNRYRIIGPIGRGGMGRVYKVVHTKMGKVAAMKVLHGALAKNPELVRRFHQEATSISKLNHPNIVQIFDFGQVDNTLFLVMEYLKGEDLSHILRRDGPLDVGRCFTIIGQICDALMEAHGLQIIHRDLKPENVRISRTLDGKDFVKVMDFGLAKILEQKGKQGEFKITAQGSLVGTPYYMAPETIRARPFDQRVDIYSLGAMAYRMLTAQNAFVAKTPIGVLSKHLSEEAQPPSLRAPERHIPPEVDAIVLRAMAKDPDRRYTSAAQLKQDLLQVQRVLQRQQEERVVPGGRRESDAFLGPDEPTPHPPLSPLAPVSADHTPERLSKEDLDFERKLKRGGRGIWLLLLPLVLAGLGLAVYWFALSDTELVAPIKEVEPNDMPARATPLLPGTAIAGHIGQRVSATESDRDWYRVEFTGDRTLMLHAKVSGVRNMDITLELYDSSAGRIFAADSSGKGGGEVITNWVVEPGQYFLLVREVWQTDVPPTENVTDAYSLEVRVMPYSRAWEMEPNDKESQASLVEPGTSVKGYLGRVEDVDTYKVQTENGLLAGMVSGIAGVDVVLEILQPGHVKKVRRIDDEAESAGERFNGLKVSKDAPVLLRVRRKDNEKVAAGIHTVARGVDEPYTLKTWLVPTK